MRDEDLYTQILGIRSPWQVADVELSVEAGEVKVYVEPEHGAEHRCPKCGAVSPGEASDNAAVQFFRKAVQGRMRTSV